MTAQAEIPSLPDVSAGYARYLAEEDVLRKQAAEADAKIDELTDDLAGILVSENADLLQPAAEIYRDKILRAKQHRQGLHTEFVALEEKLLTSKHEAASKLGSMLKPEFQRRTAGVLIAAKALLAAIESHGEIDRQLATAGVFSDDFSFSVWPFNADHLKSLIASASHAVSEGHCA